MRDTVRSDPPLPSAPETTNRPFRLACYTATAMLILVSTGLAVTAVYTAKRVHGVQFSTPWGVVWENHGAYVALLAVFSYTVLGWLFIVVWIHAYWPDGWIYKKRTRHRPGPGEGAGGDVEMELPEPLVPAQMATPKSD